MNYDFNTKGSIMNGLKLIQEFFLKLRGKKGNAHIAQDAEGELAVFTEHLNLLAKCTSDELNTMVGSLKLCPKQTDMQLRDMIKTLKYFPSQTRKQWTFLVSLLMCFPEITKMQTSTLVEHIDSLSKLRKEEADFIIERLNNLPQCSATQSYVLIEDIESTPLAKDIKQAMISFIKRITLSEHAQFLDKIKNLEQSSQEELTVLVDLIKKHIRSPAMIVLFGSYAKGKEVIYDEHYENRVLTSYQSDFDIMVVVKKPLSEIKTYNKIEQLLGGIVTEEYDVAFADREHAPPQFIVENIDRLAKNLKRRQPFFTDIVAEGIVLYDNGEVVLPEPQELSFQERKEIAQEMYDECIEYADSFLKHGYYAYKDANYKMAAFQTHQACENYYRTLGSVFDNYSPKLHDLAVFVAKTKGYSRDLASVFPRTTEFEKSTFKLLREAYIRARYDPKYVVTREELAYMLERVEVLKGLTYRLCEERLSYYGRMVDEQGETKVLQT